ncbi:RNA polymerase, sigma-24 subunit, RpoE [Nakamurella panacisegetis]|uniref:RNA polymerase, sigma-24 subunit, RpoE n=2 Tax=Nakamurella panacisegetis TaxID=1090615 RepID=A0A1H0L1B2_9ACTN|nr:RNA polymerase, sigma-24 subunit, RpoE [Nakamurella panacisegetis]
MAAIAAGDQAAFGALFVRFSAGVQRIVLTVVRDPAQSDEVVQEVFLTIWREAARFDPARSSVAGYVTMLARGKAVDRVRASQASRSRDERYRVSNLDRHDHYDPVIELALLREESSQVRSALAGLTRFQREAIELHYLDGLTYLEVGRLLGVSAGTVKSRVRSGMASLRLRLGGPDWVG